MFSKLFNSASLHLIYSYFVFYKCFKKDKLLCRERLNVKSIFYCPFYSDHHILSVCSLPSCPGRRRRCHQIQHRSYLDGMHCTVNFFLQEMSTGMVIPRPVSVLLGALRHDLCLQYFDSWKGLLVLCTSLNIFISHRLRNRFLQLILISLDSVS